MINLSKQAYKRVDFICSCNFFIKDKPIRKVLDTKRGYLPHL